MTVAALDPWVFEVSRADYELDVALKAFELFEKFVDEHPDLLALRFLGPEFWELAASRSDDAITVPFQSSEFMRAATMLASSSAREDLVPSVSARWLMEVSRILRSDEHPDWRDPVICIPGSRKASWPVQNGEYTFAPTTLSRVVVVLGAESENAFFVSDFDPWKSERLRAPDGEKLARDLPRPTVCDGCPMGEWALRMCELPTPNLAKGTCLHFVPDDTWDPTVISKKDWRNGPFAQDQKLTRKGLKKGPQDGAGRIWCWDEAHRKHWDVQHHDDEDDRYMNVACTGVVTKAY